MKTSLACLIALVIGFSLPLHAESPACEITAHCFSMTAKEASEFMLTYNPAGQAGFSMEQLEKLVAQKKATFLGTLSTQGGSGLRLKSDGKGISMETESVVSQDGASVDILSTVSFPDQAVTSNVVCNKNQFVFAGNSTPGSQGSGSKTKVYLVYLLTRISK